MEKDLLLAKWLNNEITEEELYELKSSPEYASYIKISEATTAFQIPEFDKVGNFKALSSRIEALKNKPKVLRIKPLTTFLKIAAIFIVLFSGYVFINSLETTVKTQIAEKQTLLLPDNSQVVLNANSTIVYNKSKWDQKRTLDLSGEAYFEVSKGEKFSVNTQEGIVTVLGTQFNVFSRDSNFYIKCYEGLVSVSFNDTLIKLPAGRKLNIENGIIIEHKTINKASPSWILNESSFDNAILSIVIKELERQYPVKVKAENIDLNQKFSGSFSHKDLNLALTLICDPLNLSFTILSKDEVLLYAKDKK